MDPPRPAGAGTGPREVPVALEIERKFLVAGEAWRPLAVAAHAIVQGYLCAAGGVTVRVRRRDDDWFLTVKGPAAGGARPEFEYPLPAADGPGLLALCADRLVVKTRHVVPVAGLRWEVDVFEQDNAGLVLAECELADPGQEVRPPSWVGREVTADLRYANARLSLHPYRRW